MQDLPRGLHVWRTEWNQTGRFTSGGSQIWTQVLAVDAVALDATMDPRVTTSLLHDIVDGAKQPQDVSTSVVFPLFTDGSGGSFPCGERGSAAPSPSCWAPRSASGVSTGSAASEFAC